MNDLPTLDAELYRSLMLLRDYQGDAEDLALAFTITDADLGDHREVRFPDVIFRQLIFETAVVMDFAHNKETCFCCQIIVSNINEYCATFILLKS